MKSIISTFICLLTFYSPLHLAKAHAATPKQPDGNEAQVGVNIAKELSKAFASAARIGKPSTVFITAETDGSEGDFYFEGRDPFGFFSDEFFGRHFGMSPRRRTPARPQIAQGSGFIVTDDGYIMTNYHVVQNAKKLRVTLHGDNHQEQEYTATFIGGDPQTDTAVLKMDSPPSPLPYLEFANSDEVEVGEWVLAIGSPFQLESSVTAGIVSATGRKGLQVSELENFIQTDAAINPGNSGGPLINLDGKVIGINTAIVAPSGGNLGIGFAVPSFIAQNVMDQLIKTGSVNRGYLGVSLQPVDKELAESFNLGKPEGAIVVEVLSGSPGEKAGLQQGDIIVEVNGHSVKSPDSVRNDVMLSNPGSTVQLKINRKGKILSLPVTLGSHLSEYTVTAESTRALGITVEDVNSENIRKYRINPEEEGVVVVDVKQGSLGARAGIQPGFLILAIDHKKITSTKQFDESLKGLSQKSRVLLLVKQGSSTRFYSLKLK